MLAGSPVLQLNCPVVEIVELVLIGAREVQEANLELMGEYFVIVFAAHKANLYFSSLRLVAVSLLFGSKVEVERHDLEPELFWALLGLLFASGLLPLVPEGHDLSRVSAELRRDVENATFIDRSLIQFWIILVETGADEATLDVEGVDHESTEPPVSVLQFVDVLLGQAVDAQHEECLLNCIHILIFLICY